MKGQIFSSTWVGGASQGDMGWEWQVRTWNGRGKSRGHGVGGAGKDRGKYLIEESMNCRHVFLLNRSQSWSLGYL